MRTPVELFDSAVDDFVQAELFDEVTVEHFEEAQAQWRPQVQKAATTLYLRGQSGKVPHHRHWQWTRKAPMLDWLAVKFFGIAYEGTLQGLIEVQTAGHQCRLAEQAAKPLVYVDYLEVAPWNVKLLSEALGHPPRLRAVGSRLIEAAVRLSIDEGFKGRLGLHSLPESEGFYIHACGMTPFGKDAQKEDLLWCEFTPEQARKFLPGDTP